ncbi:MULTISPECIES: hypothetical protein [unclassified Pseudomonas]|uniref:hypothetical protein n=1 Tax=unclassified Pseudomonas TaxID=196821 RepID=UPI00087664A3|nr:MULTISPECIES: hypothetical protein [unclassified Pseudomonas]SCZ41296.1 hypothetical protein SAMN03159405_04516 [Pseudomonas sp. NFACC44-2]SDA89414.1 hypothetical protein SAMN03159429_05579 [Pseudomonas sp. NFACC51]SEJ96979.1 hypothetical protein SAMN03159298_05413 [Pseudomonas sp. NFACC07-1]SFI31566.1 hypothetical protein SAMN03159302_03851 [Pseudomonas sp. NFACC54]SFT27024.1 hypothetical protein SAMN03159306_05238 [Pseudomonas sp. NFACC48-1]
MLISSPGSPVARSIPNEAGPDIAITINDRSPHTTIEMFNAHIPAEEIAPLSSENLRFALMSVEEALHEIETEQKGSTDNATQKFIDAITVQLDGGPDGPVLTDDIGLNIPNLAQFETSSHSSESDTFIRRGQIILEYLGEQLGKLVNNEFEGDLGRWASNLTISSVRTGLVTATLTVIRQLAGFALEKTLQSNAASPLTRSVISTVVQSLGPLLNVLGAIRDECNNTASWETRAARLVTLVLSVLAFAAAATVPTALPALAPFVSQMAFYTFAQDLVSLFCPTGDNAKASPGGTVIAGLLNGMLQFLSFTGMNYTAPHSGPGYVMAQGNQPLPPESEGLAFQLANWMEQQANAAPGANLSVEERAKQIVESLIPVLGHDMLRGLLNGGADVFGQVFMGEAGHALQEEPSEEGFRVAPISFRIPTAEQAANQLLSTNAIRTSVGQIIMSVVISASRYFSTLPIPKEVVDHIANLLVAAVVFAARTGTAYVNARSTPA